MESENTVNAELTIPLSKDEEPDKTTGSHGDEPDSPGGDVNLPHDVHAPNIIVLE